MAPSPSKKTTPKPSPRPAPKPADPNVVDFDAEVDPDVVIAHARGTFRASDKLKGIKHRHGVVPLFLDLEAVDDYQKLNQMAQIVTDAAGKVDVKEDGGAERHAALLEQYNELEPKVEAAKVKMLQSALSIHLHAWPNIAAKVARRKAIKRFYDDSLGGVPPERNVEASEYVDMLLLGSSIMKIVDAEGNVDTLQPYEAEVTDEHGNVVMKKGKPKTRRIIPRETIGFDLSNDLPPSQWARLYDAYQKLTLTDQLGENATNDPGF